MSGDDSHLPPISLAAPIRLAHLLHHDYLGRELAIVQYEYSVQTAAPHQYCHGT